MQFPLKGMNSTYTVHVAQRIREQFIGFEGVRVLLSKIRSRNRYSDIPVLRSLVRISYSKKESTGRLPPRLRDKELEVGLNHTPRMLRSIL